MVFVGHADVIESDPFLVFHQRLVLDLEDQVADAAEALSVVRSDAVGRQAGNVLARGVSRVVVPNIVRVSRAQPRHQQIAGDFGEDRSAGDAETAGIAMNDRGVRNGKRRPTGPSRRTR